MQYWLVKQEPGDFSWTDLVRDKRTAWTGVRNFQARKNLREMKNGDEVFFYHTGDEKQIVGLAQVVREAYADPTATEGEWCAVDISPVKPLKRAVPLQEIKSDKILKDMKLVRQMRLSVVPVTDEQFKQVLRIAGS